jgi:hypothetical protein
MSPVAGPCIYTRLISQFAPLAGFLFLLASHLLPPMLRNNVAGMKCRMILILALVVTVRGENRAEFIAADITTAEIRGPTLWSLRLRIQSLESLLF